MAAERAAPQVVDHKSHFWSILLWLIGAAVWCVPRWKLLSGVHSPGGIVDFPLRLSWFMTTWVVAPAAVINFIAGICSLFP